jgi:hypothetical protein
MGGRAGLPLDSDPPDEDEDEEDEDEEFRLSNRPIRIIFISAYRIKCINKSE